MLGSSNIGGLLITGPRSSCQNFGVIRCILGSFGAFFKGSFLHLSWISNIVEIIYLNFLRSPDDLKRSQRSLTMIFLKWPE